MKPTIRLCTFVMTVSVCCSALTWAVSPPPDGGYPNANTAEGDQALFSLTTGIDNVAVGFNSLFSNTTGNSNTAIGFYTMANNLTGNFNTAYGQFALQSNQSANKNTAVGYNALFNNTTGNHNTALGASAGINLTTGDGNIDIDNPGVAGDSKTIRIGTPLQRATYIAGISGATIPSGVSVVVDSEGHLGTITSSIRYKDAVETMAEASEAIFDLRPVTFRYRAALDPKGVPQFGLVAEEVAKVNRDLVARDREGKPFTVRYDAVNAMLLNEFLKEHKQVTELARKNREQDRRYEDQSRKLEGLEATVAAQARQIQSLSVRLNTEISRREEVQHSTLPGPMDPPASR